MEYEEYKKLVMREMNIDYLVDAEDFILRSVFDNDYEIFRAINVIKVLRD